ncbi:hypothetical protein DPMN_191152 [Dreissena polymorpha]|uniref:Uncharacterized protein n=1 Tax=Dreissena polymorpha TaxID=45954 RepID=A0A9D3Y038_DREPO|nr:hypothetical protein DPMN_191152 [Dreissena polymorpha]
MRAVPVRVPKTTRRASLDSLSISNLHIVPLKPAWTYYVTLVYVSGLEERAGKRMKEGASERASERADRQASE